MKRAVDLCNARNEELKLGPQGRPGSKKKLRAHEQSEKDTTQTHIRGPVMAQGDKGMNMSVACPGWKSWELQYGKRPHPEDGQSAGSSRVEEAQTEGTNALGIPRKSGEVHQEMIRWFENVQGAERYGESLNLNDQTIPHEARKQPLNYSEGYGPHDPRASFPGYAQPFQDVCNPTGDPYKLPGWFHSVPG